MFALNILFSLCLFANDLILTTVFLKKNTSRNQERHLDTLHNFVTRATKELIWLNEKEESEVAYDWSERNSNIARKKGYHTVSRALSGAGAGLGELATFLIAFLMLPR